MNRDLHADRASSLAIELFEYPDSGKPVLNLWGDFPEVGTLDSFSSSKPDNLPVCDSVSEETDKLDQSVELQRSFEAGREQGICEGRKQEQEERRARWLEIEQERIATAAEFASQFAHERDRFLESIEQEVVKLALGIAERVLRREAQLDPLFLAGAVRVALGHLAENLHVRLRVPATDAELWIETLKHVPNLRVKPEIVSEQAMQSGNCLIESEMGSADLGLSAQLGTIQRSLLRASNATERPAPVTDGNA